ncbi:MAG: hypothetical protein U1F87_00255 [Kiritimatiellia bacterium]
MAAGATVSLVGGNHISVDALSGAGTVQNINNWGTGILTVGQNNGRAGSRRAARQRRPLALTKPIRNADPVRQQHLHRRHHHQRRCPADRRRRIHRHPGHGGRGQQRLPGLQPLRNPHRDRRHQRHRNPHPGRTWTTTGRGRQLHRHHLCQPGRPRRQRLAPVRRTDRRLRPGHLRGGGAAGSVTLPDGSTFEPGDETDNWLELQELSSETTVLKYELQTRPGTGIPGDHVTVAGAFVLDGLLQIGNRASQPDPYDFTTAVEGDSWLLMTYAPGSLSDNGLIVDIPNSAPLADGLSYSVATNAIDASTSGVYLTVVAVPEAGTGALAVLGLVLLLRRRLRR